MVVIECTSKLCPKISIPISFEKDILAWWECLVSNDKCPKSKTVGLTEYRQPCDRDGVRMKGFALSSWGNAAITFRVRQGSLALHDSGNRTKLTMYCLTLAPIPPRSSHLIFILLPHSGHQQCTIWHSDQNAKLTFDTK